MFYWNNDIHTTNYSSKLESKGGKLNTDAHCANVKLNEENLLPENNAQKARKLSYLRFSRNFWLLNLRDYCIIVAK